MSTLVIELAEAIKEKGRRSTQELPSLLERAEELAGDDRLNDLSRALAHRAAGNARQLMSSFDLALASYDKAISILECIEEPTELGRTLHAKAGLLNFMCRFDDLLVCAERARSIFESLNDRHRLARLDANLSGAYARLNRFDMVLRLTERAIPVLESVGDLEGCVTTLLNSAVALRLMNDFEEAERRYSRARRIAEEQNWVDLARTARYNAAFLLYLRGNAAEALREIGELRSSYEDSGDRRQVCLCFLNEAEILLEIGDLEGAVETAIQAKALAQGLGLSLEMGRALVLEAAADRRLNSTVDSEELLNEATKCFERERNDVWAAVAKLEIVLLRGERNDSHVLEEALGARALIQETGLPGHLALADVVVGRIHKSRGDHSAALSAFRAALLESRQGRSEWMQFHAARELGTLLAEKSPQEALLHLRSAERNLDSLWQRLGSDDLKLAFLNDRDSVYTPLVRLALKESPESAFALSEKARSRVLAERLATPAADTASLAGCLSADEVVVEYFIEGTDLLIFTLTQTGVSCHRQEKGAIEAQAIIENFDRHIKSCSVGWEHLVAARRHQRLTAETHLRELYRILVEPIAANLRKRMIVVPHGVLHRVPFHALWNGNSYLADSCDIAYSPSAALYCSPASGNSSDSAVFIAFSGAQKTTAEDEVREGASKVSGSHFVINPTIAELQDVFKTPHALVHIAGHAGIDAIDGRLSWIETAQGRLTNRDLSDLSIRARTIVITGCQTARRTIRPGDEWQGLMRSFYMAGASAVVSALWDVRDQSAREFASEFYNNFSGNNVLSAVQTATRSVRLQHDHPYFWAGFSTFIRACE